METITLYPNWENIDCKVWNHPEISKSVITQVDDIMLDTIIYQKLSTAREIMSKLYQSNLPSKTDKIKAKFTYIWCSKEIDLIIKKYEWN
jgi:hypothetical protein